MALENPAGCTPDLVLLNQPVLHDPWCLHIFSVFRDYRTRAYNILWVEESLHALMTGIVHTIRRASNTDGFTPCGPGPDRNSIDDLGLCKCFD